MTQPGLLSTGGVFFSDGAAKSKPSNCRPQEGEIELFSGGDVSLASNRPDPHVNNNQPRNAHLTVCLDVSSQSVTALVARLFTKKQSDSQTLVQEIGEGSSNRVYGITVTSLDWQSLEGKKQYVLRVPYDRDFDGKKLELELLQENAKLEVIGPRLSRLSVPTPRVLNYDVTSNNVLNGPFTLRPAYVATILRIAGTN